MCYKQKKSVFNIIAGINESKILTKDISCEAKCQFMEQNVFQINRRITKNVKNVVA